jgi:hypothetical protein
MKPPRYTNDGKVDQSPFAGKDLGVTKLANFRRPAGVDPSG